MTRKPNLLLLATIAITSALAAVVLDRTVTAQAAFAAPGNRAVEAQSFVLVSPSGQKRAELGFDRLSNPTLTFFDEQGKAVWSAPGAKVVPAR